MPTEGGESELENLVHAARAGSPAARQRLVEAHLPGLRAFVRLRLDPVLRAKESSSDVVQSVCLEVIEKIACYEYRGPASFRHWLYTLATHKIIDHQRYWAAQRRDAGREAAFDQSLARGYSTITNTTPSVVAMQREDIAHLEAALDRLPPHYREVIVLARLVGLPLSEVARQMDRTEGATSMLLRRALVRLTGILGER